MNNIDPELLKKPKLDRIIYLTKLRLGFAEHIRTRNLRGKTTKVSDIDFSCIDRILVDPLSLQKIAELYHSQITDNENSLLFYDDELSEFDERPDAMILYCLYLLGITDGAIRYFPAPPGIPRSIEYRSPKQNFRWVLTPTVNSHHIVGIVNFLYAFYSKPERIYEQAHCLGFYRYPIIQGGGAYVVRVGEVFFD